MTEVKAPETKRTGNEPKAAWIAPTISKIRAGDAETGAMTSEDGVTVGS